MNTQSFSSLPTTAIQWLWPNFIPRGRLTLLIANPGLGKTTLALDLAARLSRGSPMPPDRNANPNPNLNPDRDPQARPDPLSESIPPSPLASLLFSPEDSPADTLRPRLESMHANLDLIHFTPNFHSLIPTNDFSPIDTLQSLIAPIPNLAFILFDPITCFLPRAKRRRSKDALDPDPTQLALDNLAAFSHQHNLAILLTIHPVNNFTRDDPHSLRRALGGLPSLADLRSILLLAAAPDSQQDNPDDSSDHNRLLVTLKSNLTEPPPDLKLSLTSSIRWDTDPTEPELRDSRLAKAAEFLQYILQKGPWFAKMIQSHASRQNIAERTLRRAKSMLAIHSTFHSSEWYWSLPDDLRPLPTLDDRLSAKNGFRR